MTSLGMILAQANPGPAPVPSDSFWMPVRASSAAGEVDWLFYFIFYVSLFFFALIVGLMIWFTLRYRRRKGEKAEGGASHNTMLELVWSGIPLLLVIGIFLVGFQGYMRSVVSPDSSYEIQVTAMKWKWLFTYPNGHVDENLHVPVETPVRLVMTSSGVIHSLYIPAFRLKKDVVPGRYNKMWFRAVKPGEYVLFCAEYCGTAHSDMLATVVVHPPGEFEKWLADAANLLKRLSPAEAGAKLFMSRGCAQCHSVDGKPGIGPTMKGLFGHSQIVTNGQTVTVDENFIRESILEPQAKVAAGFDPVMPSYQGRLSDPEIAAIIEYTKTLK